MKELSQSMKKLDLGKIDLPYEQELFSTAWETILPHLPESVEDRCLALLRKNRHRWIERAARHLAHEQGIELEARGVEFLTGGLTHEDVAIHALKPMLEFLWKFAPACFLDNIVDILKHCRPRSWRMPWMLDFLEHEVAMVESPTDRTIVFRADRLVATASGRLRKHGRLACRVHKTEAAAIKDAEKKLAAAEAKYGSTRADWDGLSSLAVLTAAAAEDPFELLLAAIKAEVPDDLDGLIRRGVDPSQTRVNDRGHERGALWAAGSPATVRLLLEAGVRKGINDCLHRACAERLPFSSSPYRPSLATLACSLLLEAGADVNDVQQGLTPLHRACEADLARVIPALVDAGADLSATTGPKTKSPGLTPLELATKHKSRKVIAALEQRSGASP